MMINKLIILFFCSLIPIIVWAQPFEVAIMNESDLKSLEPTYRILRLDYPGYTYKTVEDIFRNFSHVQQVETSDHLFFMMCGKRGNYIEKFNRTSLKPISYRVKISVEVTSSKIYDVDLQNCLRESCPLTNKGNILLSITKYKVFWNFFFQLN